MEEIKINLQTNTARLQELMGDQIESQLVSATKLKGRLPSSLEVINRLSAMDNLKVAKDIANCILPDQILTLRAIALSNYSYYHPPKPITTIEKAVEHFRVDKVINLFSTLAEVKSFSSFYQDKAVATTMLQQSLIAADVAKRLIDLIYTQESLSSEAYIFSSLINSSLIAIAAFCPIAYSALCLDSMDEISLFPVYFKQLTGKTLGAQAAMTAGTLGLPKLYHDCSIQYDLISKANFNLANRHISPEQAIALAALCAEDIAQELCYFTGIQGIQSLIRRLSQKLNLNPIELEGIVSTIPASYINNAKMLGISPNKLPEYLCWFSPSEDTAANSWQNELPSISDRIGSFLNELHQVISNASSTENLIYAVYSTLIALVRGLNFDRAVILQAENDRLTIAASLGVKLFEPTRFKRNLHDEKAEEMPDVQAYLYKKVIFSGTPVFPDGWPFVAFPIISGEKVLGVFYADKIKRPNRDSLSSQEEVACIAISEEWQNFTLKKTRHNTVS